MRTTTKGKIQSSKSRRMICGLALMASVATPAIAASPGVALADGARHSHHHHRSADVTFTKWVVEGPADPSTLAGVLMVGVVGGDVGDGRFAGEVLGDDTTSKPGFWLARVRYEFHGSEHSFVADVRVTEDDRQTPITATIRGVVARGWLKGAHVTGEYTQTAACPIPTPGNVLGAVCWQGTLHLQLGHGHS
jgi:hypothetical protein